MSTTMSSRAKLSIAGVAAAVLMTACATDTFSPAERIAAPTAAFARGGNTQPALGSCDRLRAPEGSTFAFHAYAKGVQIYRWDGQQWAPVGPSAELYANAGYTGLVGTHYAGPRWQSNSGSTVRGEVLDRCVYDANAIPWLTLKGVPESGPGVFAHATFIQRVNTAGGKAPSTPGTLNEVVEVPYTAEYYFYRAP
jgi:hypothetical protein